MTAPDLQADAAGRARLPDSLSTRRSRLAVAALREADVPLSLADLAGEIVARERGSPSPASDLDRDALRQCQIMLYHNHVPRLADAGLVEFDPDRRTVSLAE